MHIHTSVVQPKSFTKVDKNVTWILAIEYSGTALLGYSQPVQEVYLICFWNLYHFSCTIYQGTLVIVSILHVYCKYISANVAYSV